ncbi:MAG: hypothetical protein RLZZ214_197 [Verrucomicrobiota bacterium]
MILLGQDSDTTEDDANDGIGLMRQGLLRHREAKVEPIPLPKNDHHLQRSFRARQTQWVEALLLADFPKRNAGAPWLDDAVAVLREAAPYLSGENYKNELTGKLTYPPATLIQRAKAASSGGCDDPLFNVITPYLESYSRPRAPEQMDLAERRLTDLLQGADSPHLKLFACSWIWGGRYDHRATKDKAKKAAMEQELPQLLADALDASESPEDSLGFYQFIKRSQGYVLLYLKRDEDETRVAFEKSKAAAWLKDTLIGEFEVEAAWKKRGSGFADTVTEDGWKGFREHLTKAAEHLSTAWKANPDVPFAAEKMIEVTMGGAGLDSITERGWFDRATAACFDYLPAYDSLLWAYRPRWGGSHDLMLAFGKACAKTRRYDTFVPNRLIRAFAGVASELPDHGTVFDDPEIRGLTSGIVRGSMSDAKTDEDKHYSLSFDTCNAFLARDYALAATCYQALGQSILPAADSAIQSYGFLPFEWRGVLAAQGDPAAFTILQKAGRAYRKGDLAAARPLYFSLSELPSIVSQPDATALVRIRLAAIAFEERFAKRDWVRLDEEEHKWLWIPASVAKWNALPDGVLSVTNEKDRALSRVILGARVGLDFEVRARLDNLPGPGGPQFGGVVGYLPGRTGFATVVCGTTDRTTDTGAALVAQSYDTDERNQPVAAELKPNSLIRIVSQNGQVTFWVDEKKIFTRDLDASFKRRSPSRSPGKEQHFFGFGSRLFPKGESRLTDIEFRDLTGK